MGRRFDPDGAHPLLNSSKNPYAIYMNSRLGIPIRYTLFIIVLSLNLFVMNVGANSTLSSCSKNEIGNVKKSGNSFLKCSKAGNKFNWVLSNKKTYLDFKKKIAAEKKLESINNDYITAQEEQAKLEKQALEAEEARKLAEAEEARKLAEAEEARKQSVLMGAAYKCELGKYCGIGNTGIGGGIVFSGAGIAGKSNHYEYAPKGWNKTESDPGNRYCGDSGSRQMSVPNKPGFTYFDNRVGDGRNATDILVAKCPNSAATLARDYLGGNLSDWFLPSQDELSLLFNSINKNGLPMLDRALYWSSSEWYESIALAQDFFNGVQKNVNKATGLSVRPIRQF